MQQIPNYVSNAFVMSLCEKKSGFLHTKSSRNGICATPQGMESAPGEPLDTIILDSTCSWRGYCLQCAPFAPRPSAPAIIYHCVRFSRGAPFDKRCEIRRHRNRNQARFYYVCRVLF